jgi:hypothetical protein
MLAVTSKRLLAAALICLLLIELKAGARLHPRGQGQDRVSAMAREITDSLGMKLVVIPHGAFQMTLLIGVSSFFRLQKIC